MGIRVEIQPAALILAAAGLLLLPMEWFAAAIAAAAFHESGHLIVLKWLHLPCRNLSIGAAGARIETGFLTSAQEFLCAAAGPVASLFLLLFWKVFPRMAVFGLVQGLFNLIPVYPMDGGRMLRIILFRLIPDSAELLMKLLSLVFVFALCLCLIRLKMYGLLIAAGLYLLTKPTTEKFLANRRGNDYNSAE